MTIMGIVHCVYIGLFLVFCLNGIQLQSVTIDVHNSGVAQQIDSRYIGVTLDSYELRNHFKPLNFNSQRLLTLARGLTPCYLRLGGTDADYVVFNKNSHVGRDVDKRFILNANKYTFGTSDWDRVNGFVKNAGLDFIFDLNLSLRKNGRWDPTNAKELFQYSIQKGYRFAGIELGNEMEYNKDTHVTAQQSAQDFVTLKQVINSMPGLSHPKIYGPAVAGIFYQSFTYAEDFLKAGGANNVDVLTYHHYYTSGPKATVEMYHDHKVLDTLKAGLTSVMNARNKYAHGKTVWLGETSAAYSSAAGDLNRLYVASFPWLDKLGVAALYGVKGLMRQALYAGLVDEHTNPRNVSNTINFEKSKHF
ncbi:heparanase-like [Patella vulgata]|uniref:heparanase-like n=1 Tax=Patella vulgata TaxID=6465 RepID=UPI002180021E|nr:heparanase-like [Patella vulgata]